jgi:hypothetical protein
MQHDADELKKVMEQVEVFSKLGMWGRARVLLDGLPVAWFQHPRVLEARACLLGATGQVVGALALAQRVSSAFPARPAALFRLACTYAAAGDLASAKAAAIQCMELDQEWRLTILDEPSLRAIW